MCRGVYFILSDTGSCYNSLKSASKPESSCLNSRIPVGHQLCPALSNILKSYSSKNTQVIIFSVLSTILNRKRRPGATTRHREESETVIRERGEPHPTRSCVGPRMRSGRKPRLGRKWGAGSPALSRFGGPLCSALLRSLVARVRTRFSRFPLRLRDPVLPRARPRAPAHALPPARSPRRLPSRSGPPRVAPAPWWVP